MSARSTATRRCCGSWPTSLHKADGPTHLAVILDASSKTFRNEMYDQYKANRPPPPPDLVPQFPLIRDATRAFSLPCIEETGSRPTTSSPATSKAALGAGLEGHDRVVRQGSDAADRARARHARHDERPADRPRGCDREVRRAARAGGRRAGADGRQRRQCPRRPRHRPQDRVEADPANMATSRRCSPPRPR